MRPEQTTTAAAAREKNEKHGSIKVPDNPLVLQVHVDQLSILAVYAVREIKFVNRFAQSTWHVLLYVHQFYILDKEWHD